MKWSDASVSKALLYLIHKFPGTEAFQIHFAGTKDCMNPEGVRAMPALDFFRELV